MNTFYKPLDALGNRVKTFERFVEWYLILWNPNHPDLMESTSN